MGKMDFVKINVRKLSRTNRLSRTATENTENQWRTHTKNTKYSREIEREKLRKFKIQN